MRRLWIAAFAMVFAVPAGLVGQSPIVLERVPNEGKQLQVQVDAVGTAHLVFFRGEDAGGDLFYARRRAGEVRFGEALRINTTDGAAVATGTTRGAQLAVEPDGAERD